jgi:hypothetical protein
MTTSIRDSGSIKGKFCVLGIMASVSRYKYSSMSPIFNGKLGTRGTKNSQLYLFLALNAAPNSGRQVHTADEFCSYTDTVDAAGSHYQYLMQGI